MPLENLQKNEGLLDDQVVLEIGGHVSGPTASSELVKAGALVIKVEFGHGDPARAYLSPEIFAQFNAGKKSIVVDKNSSAYANLLSRATVIIDNRSPAAKNRDRILQDFLRNPNKNHPVIFCSIVGYDSSEHAERRALDVSVQAETGMAMVNAPSAGFPLKVGFVVIDYVTGLHAAKDIFSHLYAIKKGYPIPPAHHQVIFIETSMARVSANLTGGQYLNYKMKKIDTFRKGNRDAFLAPFSFYKAQDEKSLAIGIVDNDQFSRFCTRVLNKPELVEKYPNNVSRLGNDRFEEEICQVLATQNSQHWLDLCKKENIACSRVNTIGESIKTYGEKFFFSKTTNGMPIMARPSVSSLFKLELEPAPALGEHKNLARPSLLRSNL